jgi:molybdopterin converting factor small subunit
MALVRLPGTLQGLANGASSVEASGVTLRSLIDDLDRLHPGMRDQIVESGAIRPDVMIAIDADEVRDLDAGVPEGAEVHILPAIAGG